ncbi:MAG: MBL fold metallo-hydrolase [Pseudothermotoga sp.]
MGLIKFSKDVILIDSGIDDSYGRKALKIISENGLRLSWLINTHFHADHIGGNAFIQAKTESKILAHRLTKPFVENPVLEPILLYSGADPIEELTTKFFKAQPSKVDHVFDGESLFEDVKIIELPGHAIGQIGLALNGVVYAADSLFGREVIEKQRMIVYSDIEAALQSIEKLKAFEVFVPSHGSPSKSQEFLSQNKSHIEEIAEKIYKLLSEPKSEEQLLCEISSELGMEIKEIGLYYLLRMTLLAYLKWFKQRGLVQPQMMNNKVVWYKL